MNTKHTAALAVVALSCLAGCSRYVEDEWSRQWPKRVPAGGTVEYQGQPVEAATVVFVAEGPGGKEYSATGMTDAKGRFTLRTFRDGDGAIVGLHRVQVEKIVAEKIVKAETKPIPGRGADDQAFVEKNVLPAKYDSYATSGLTAEVAEKGPNQFVFRLEEPPPAAKAGR